MALASATALTSPGSALARTSLELAQLGDDARRALASPQTKGMAARGLLPIARPRDLLAVFYQLALDESDDLRTIANQGATGLPAPVVRGGLSDPAIDSRVLDYFAEVLATAAGAIELILANPAVADATLVAIASRASEREADLIASNEVRLLAAPEIIAALYHNKRARMSTVDRVVELAVRNGVRVEGVPAWEEIQKVYAVGSAERDVPPDLAAADEAFARAARVNEGRRGDGSATPDEAESRGVATLTVPMKIRLATLGNAFDRAVLIRDSKKMVAMAAIKAPGVTDAEAVKYAGLNALPEEVIGYIASRRDWTKLYSVKVTLVNNPKCPVGAAMRLLPHLREKDIDGLARSKGIPTAVAAQARKLVAQRRSGSRK